MLVSAYNIICIYLISYYISKLHMSYKEVTQEVLVRNQNKSIDSYISAAFNNLKYEENYKYIYMQNEIFLLYLFKVPMRIISDSYNTI